MSNIQNLDIAQPPPELHVQSSDSMSNAETSRTPIDNTVLNDHTCSSSSNHPSVQETGSTGPLLRLATSLIDVFRQRSGLHHRFQRLLQLSSKQEML